MEPLCLKTERTYGHGVSLAGFLTPFFVSRLTLGMLSIFSAFLWNSFWLASLDHGEDFTGGLVTSGAGSAWLLPFFGKNEETQLAWTIWTAVLNLVGYLYVVWVFFGCFCIQCAQHKTRKKAHRVL